MASKESEEETKQRGSTSHSGHTMSILHSIDQLQVNEFLVRRRILINDLIDCRWDSFIFFCELRTDYVRVDLTRTAPLNNNTVLFRVNNYICVVCSVNAMVRIVDDVVWAMAATVVAGVSGSSSSSSSCSSCSISRR